MTNDVAIIGVGMHPFGRFDKTAMQMGTHAIRAALLADAGLEWKDIQFAAGGSWEIANPDAIVGMMVALIPFTNVFNACATAASATEAVADAIALGKYDIGIAIGLDKHPRGAFTVDLTLVGMPKAGENGQYLTTQFRDEGQPLHPRTRHLPADPGQGRGQELPQRCPEPECVPPQADR